MKSFFKWVGISFIAIFVIGTIFMIFESDESKKAREDAQAKREYEAFQKDSTEQAIKDKVLADAKESEARREREKDSLKFEYSWSIDGFGTVVMADISFKNTSKTLAFENPYIDIEYLSGNKEVLKTDRKKVPIEVLAGKKYTNKINLGFKPEFMEYLRITVDKVTVLHN